MRSKYILILVLLLPFFNSFNDPNIESDKVIELLQEEVKEFIEIENELTLISNELDTIDIQTDIALSRVEKLIKNKTEAY